ncbi:MAG: H-NS histone family protein [Dinoroseobacter sp.]|nr:H-NS histone family protein [Dinoroseobacter sp.]
MAKKPKAKPAIDVSAMSMDELDALASDIRKAKMSLEKRRLKDARDAMEKVAREFGVSVSEVLGKAASAKKSSSGAAPAKYRNPNDASQTWSGRGRQPVWYKDAVSGGATPESLEI